VQRHEGSEIDWAGHAIHVTWLEVQRIHQGLNEAVVGKGSQFYFTVPKGLGTAPDGTARVEEKVS
jgi:hypothetical protein